MAVLACLKESGRALSLPEISSRLPEHAPERSMRRWLAAWVEEGIVVRTGRKRGTRYSYAGVQPSGSSLGFLRSLPSHRRATVLEQIRDLWTHTSTALEGNTLTLGDTHAILGLGLTVSGKSLHEHQEIVGHARAIDLLYRSLERPLDRDLIFALHKAVQTDSVQDIYKPIGAWKVEINGAYAVTRSGEQVFVEYADPAHVDYLMGEMLDFINRFDVDSITLETAPAVYAKAHMGIVHIHPFWDGNGRTARLLANALLLKAGWPPLVIEQKLRRDYIECLADYQIGVGRLTDRTGVWPNEATLVEFDTFCRRAYTATRDIIEAAIA